MARTSIVEVVGRLPWVFTFSHGLAKRGLVLVSTASKYGVTICICTIISNMICVALFRRVRSSIKHALREYTNKITWFVIASRLAFRHGLIIFAVVVIII